MTRTLVQEVMTTPVVTAAEAMPFRDLAALLYARDIGAVPVVGRPASSSAWYHDLTSSRKRPGWPPPRDCARGSGRGAGSAAGPWRAPPGS